MSGLGLTIFFRPRPHSSQASLTSLDLIDTVQQVNILTDTELCVQDTHLRSSSSVQPYHAEFTVRQDLIGLAIGAQGSNITAARRLEGVTSIDLDDDTYTFRVRGEVSLYGLRR